MKKFEYDIAYVGLGLPLQEHVDLLDVGGKQGWELITIDHQDGGRLYFFKRELPSS